MGCNNVGNRNVAYFFFQNDNIFQCGEEQYMTKDDLACSLITYQHMDLYFDDDVWKERVWNIITEAKIDKKVCPRLLNVTLFHDNGFDTGCCFCP